MNPGKMKRLIGILRATIVGGVFFLAPFVVLIIILGKALGAVQRLLVPVAEILPFESAIGLETPKLLAVAALLLLCFLAGLFARSTLARKMLIWLEDTILSNLPGYSLIKSFSEEVAGITPTHGYPVVLARFDEACQIGFLVERISEGRMVVFIPDAPNPWSGSVFILDEDRITRLDTKPSAVVTCLKKLGAGAEVILKGMEC